MNKLSQILGAAAVIAIAVVFILQFRPATGAGQANTGPTCAAEIKGSCIPTPHYWAAYSLIVPYGVDASVLRSMGLRRKTAEGLVEQHLLNEDAKRLGITVSDEDITAEIASGRAHVSLPAETIPTIGAQLRLAPALVSPLNVKDRKSGKFDAKNAEREIRGRTRLSPAEFREFQRKEMIAARMRDLVRSRAQVGEEEAFTLYAQDKSTAVLDYIRLDRRFFADRIVDNSQKAIDAWARKNQDEIDKTWQSRKSNYLPECRVTRHILIKVDDLEGDEAKAAARKKIEEALERLKKGEDFADLARELSQDGSASEGGALGCVPKGKMVKPFEDAVFALGEGKISDIVESQFGFHIIKVEKIAKDAEAEKVARQEIARELYLAHESDRVTTEAAKKILADARAGKSLKDALDAYLAEALPKEDKKDKKDDKAVEEPAHPQTPTVTMTTPFNATGAPIGDVAPGTDVAGIAFSLEKPGDVAGDLIPLQNGFAVIQLKEKKPADKEEWKKDREDYLARMRAAKQHDALVSYIERLKSKMSGEIKYSQELIKEPKLKEDEQAPEAPPGE